MSTPLDQKIKRVFPDETVNKRLARIQVLSRLPKFISEYAVKELVDEREDPSAMATLGNFVKQFYPEPKERNRVLYEIKEHGSYTLLDEFKVTVDLKAEATKVEIPSLGIRDAMIVPSVLTEHKNLLESGMWGTAKLSYRPSVLDDDEGTGQTPVLITEFSPLQYSNISLADYKLRREQFTLPEWIDVLIQTLGMNPEAYDDRSKLLYISRIIPLVENNINLMELGPRATGKSFLYKNISYYIRLYSGGQVSPAVLFYHGTFRSLGDIGTRDLVVFDEVSRIDFKNADEIMGKFKDYMESGSYERGQLKGAQSTCSIMFQGNIEIDGKVPTEDFSEVMPESMKNDSAFTERLHGMIPGWEIPKIGRSEVHLCNGYGLVTDYFCEMMHELRKESFMPHIQAKVGIDADGGDISIRDQRAIYRLTSGMMKLLSPNDSLDPEALELSARLAVEYRQRIHDWLCTISPGEYHKKTITYTIGAS
jgi:ATP-dependent Lon protease